VPIQFFPANSLIVIVAIIILLSSLCQGQFNGQTLWEQLDPTGGFEATQM
jgi:hypothetical protein